MVTRDKIVKIIHQTVKNGILGFAKKSLSKKASFQVLDLIIPKERRIRSIVGGLETSLGTTLWEPLAKALALENGFEVIQKKLEAPKNMPFNLSSKVTTILDERKRRNGSYDALKSHQEIREICQTFLTRPIESFEPAPKGFGVDIWLRKVDTNYFFDTKTVKPNVGAFSKCVEQVLNWYAYFYSRFPDQKAEARIIFPYDPFENSGGFWSRSVGKGFPLEPRKEAWVGDEFWSFCSGYPGTYQLILESFRHLKESKELEGDLTRLLETELSSRN